MTVGALILCAGASSRMGQPKALLRTTCGETFLCRIARLAQEAGATEILAVCGPPHGALLRASVQGPCRFVENEQPARGMLSSVQVGVRALSPGLVGALIWPVDVPFVQAATVQRMLAADIGRMIIPSYGQRAGHPLWVPAPLFPDLLDLPAQGPGGLRQLRGLHPPIWLPVPDGAVVRDVDTPADLG